jgi:hypothetical protein
MSSLTTSYNSGKQQKTPAKTSVVEEGRAPLSQN